MGRRLSKSGTQPAGLHASVMDINYNAELFVPGKIKTYAGEYFDAFNPDPAKVHIEDIAHALSQQPRYGGHLPKHYSVAQHSLYVSELLPKPLKLAGLLHDATEAYMPDVPSPLKARLPEVKNMENGLMKVILGKFGVWEVYRHNYSQIKEADIEALKIEWDILMQGRKGRRDETKGYFSVLQSYTMRTAEAFFILAFNELREEL